LLHDTIGFGIVTPFRLQMDRLDEAVRARPWGDAGKDRPAVGTAHRFPGDERDVVIFSPVVAGGMRPRLVRGGGDTEQLLNGAPTSAGAARLVVGVLDACLRAGGYLGRFAASARTQDGCEDAAGAANTLRLLGRFSEPAATPSTRP